MKNNSKLMWMISLILSCSGFIAFIALNSSAAPSSKQVVGVILAESGGADFIGKPEKQVLEILWKDYKTVRGAPNALEFAYYDSGSKLEQAKIIYERLARDPNTLAIIGPSTSGESIELAKQAEKDGIPLLSLAASRDIVFDGTEKHERTRRWVFKFAQNDSLAAERIVRAINEHKGRSIALLYSNDGFGKSGASQFEKAIQRNPSAGKIVHSATFPAGRLETPEVFVSALPAAVDSIVIWGTAPGPSLLVKAIRSTRSSPTIYLSHGNASDEFIKSTGVAAEGVVILGSRVLLKAQDLNASSPADKAVLQYQSLWAKHIGGTPSHFAGHARDAFEAFFRAYEAEKKPSRNGIRDRLEALQNLHGVTGTFSFAPNDHAGLTEESFEVYRISGGTFRKMKSPSP